MSDVFISFHFQLFLKLLLLIFILLLSLATVFSALTPLLLPRQGLCDLPHCNSLYDFLYHLPNKCLHLLPLCPVWGPPVQVPGTSCTVAPLSVAQMSGWACAHHTSFWSAKTSSHLAANPLGTTSGNAARANTLLTEALGAPARMHEVMVKRPGAVWEKSLGIPYG